MDIDIKEQKLIDIILLITDEYKESTTVFIKRLNQEWIGSEIRIHGADNNILYCSIFYNFDSVGNFSILFPRTGGGSYESQKKIISNDVEKIKSFISATVKSESKLNTKK